MSLQIASALSPRPAFDLEKEFEPDGLILPHICFPHTCCMGRQHILREAFKLVTMYQPWLSRSCLDINDSN